mgnify:CR=1 FL=1
MASNDASSLFTYAKRKFISLDNWQEGAWSNKFYWINADPTAPPDAEIEAAAKAFVRDQLHVPDREGHHYNRGFVMFHQGARQNWLVWNWWAFDNITSHVLANSTAEDPTSFTEYSGTIMACTWEMVILEFERRAWVENVLSGERSFDLYMSEHLPDGAY